MDMDDRRRVAVHEAAHAVTASELRGRLPRWVTIRPRAAMLGHVRYARTLLSGPAAWRLLPPKVCGDLIARLAGSAAERVFFGNVAPDAEAADRRVALDTLRSNDAMSDRARDALMAYLTVEAEDFIHGHLRTIDRGSMVLLSGQSMSGREFLRRLALQGQDR